MLIEVLCSEWDQYELVDCGDRRKLERFGEVFVVRGEPRAWWRPRLPESAWNRAQAVHDERAWTFAPDCPREWTLELDGLRLLARFTETSKHIGVFPEQWPHWRAILESGGEGRLLNLFGYTGAASMVAAKAGFEVTHVDASKPALTWARRNQELSGLQDAPLRLILDDAGKFVARELRRGKRYEAILLDPPAFGRGPKKELWKVERQVSELLAQCRELLSEQARFLILTMYNTDASALMLRNLLSDALEGLGGTLDVGELALRQTGSDKILPRSLWGRWTA